MLGGLAKVVVSLPVEFDGLAVGVDDGDFTGRAGNDLANVPQRQFQLCGNLRDGQALRSGGGETQLVIVAAGELAFEGDAAEVGVVAFALGQMRELDELDGRGAARAFGDVAKVGEQAV